MPYAFAFHYAPEVLDAVVLDEMLAWCTDEGPLEAAFHETSYVPAGQGKIRPGGSYRRAGVLERIEDPKVDAVWVRSAPGRPPALLMAGVPVGLTVAWKQVVLILHDEIITGGDAVAFAHDFVVQCPPLSGAVEWHRSHREAEAVTLGAFDDMLAPSVMDRAKQTARMAPHFGTHVRGPGWLTYLSAAHFAELGTPGVRALGAAAWGLHPAEEGALVQAAPTPTEFTPEIRTALARAFGGLLSTP